MLVAAVCVAMGLKMEECPGYTLEKIMSYVNDIIAKDHQFYENVPYYQLHEFVAMEHNVFKVMHRSLLVWHGLTDLENLLRASNLQDDPDVAPMAWIVFDEMYNTDVIVRFPPHIIALASLVVSAMVYNSKDIQYSYYTNRRLLFCEDSIFKCKPPSKNA